MNISDEVLETLVKTFEDEARKIVISKTYGDNRQFMFVVCFAFCLVAYLSSILNIIVLWRKPFSKSLNLFFLILSVSEIALISVQFVPTTLIYFANFPVTYFRNSYYFSIVLFFIHSVFDNFSNWIVVVIGTMRINIINRIFISSQFFNFTKVVIAIVTVFVLSVILACPMFLIYKEVTFSINEHVFHEMGLTEFARSSDKYPLQMYNVFVSVRSIVPLVIMVFLVVTLLMSVRAGERGTRYRFGELRSQITVMISMLLVLFFISRVPNSIIAMRMAVELDVEEDHWQTKNIVTAVMIAVRSLSFVVYVVFGVEFRRKLLCNSNNITQHTSGNENLIQMQKESNTDSKIMGKVCY